MTFVEVVNEWTTKDQELWEQFCDGGGFRMWGYNISNTHPLKAPFLLYKQMMEELEEREEDEEEEEKKYLVTDITFDDDEDGIMTEGDWEALKQEVYTTTWFALNEDDLCDQITEKTGWLVAGFECKEIC